ncbi:hypothetical protein SDC9_144948 [bioreactor metagenome]|uniref:Uncharacterized protein n=1 Tax=bioreactor metagenome TaxID=1076179 RepID=A0A645E8L9_9ZZZZ
MRVASVSSSLTLRPLLPGTRPMPTSWYCVSRRAVSGPVWILTSPEARPANMSSLKASVENSACTSRWQRAGAAGRSMLGNSLAASPWTSMAVRGSISAAIRALPRLTVAGTLASMEPAVGNCANALKPGCITDSLSLLTMPPVAISRRPFSKR